MTFQSDDTVLCHACTEPWRTGAHGPDRDDELCELCQGEGRFRQ